MRLCRRHGLRAVARLFVDRLAKRLVHLEVSHVACLDTSKLAALPPQDGEFTFRFLTPAEVRAFAADPANELDESMAVRVAAGSSVCLGVLAGDRLAGYGWCAFGSIEPDHCGGVGMSFPPDVGYMYKGFTHAEFRGKRLNVLRMALAAHALAARGIRRLVALIDWTNWSSLKSCWHAGCEDLGRVVTIGLGRRRWSFVPAAARAAGLSIGTVATSADQSVERIDATAPVVAR